MEKKTIKFYKRTSYGRERYYFADNSQKEEIAKIRLDPRHLTDELIIFLKAKGYRVVEIPPPKKAPTSPPPHNG